MASFKGGILDIPGLVPVNIGSSNPYPVPSWGPTVIPRMPTQTNQAPQGAATQNDPYVSPEFVQTGTGNPNGPSVNITDTAGGGGSYSGIDSYTPTFGMPGDAQFANFPNYGGSGFDGFGLGGDFSNFGINPAQGVSSFGGLGIGDYGQGILDRVNSLTNTPYLDDANYMQGGINLGSMFVPGLGPLAGILQGFNLLDPGERTGNSLVDMGATPGGLQSLTAEAANWVNRQFGGTAMGREHTSGDAYDVGTVPDPNSPGFGSALAAYGQPGAYDLNGNKVPFFRLNPYDQDQNAIMAGMTLNEVGGSGQPQPQYMSDPYSLTGNMWNDFMLGATFGGGRFDAPASDPMYSQTSWSSPGFGAVDRGLDPNDTN